jgi:hypothetical protein
MVRRSLFTVSLRRCAGYVVAVVAITGCVATSGSRVVAGGSTGPVPTTVPTSVATSATTGGLGVAGTATVGPGSTVSARVSGVGPSSTIAPPPPTDAPPTLPPPSTAGSGAYGYVTAGPTCPVERPGQSCPPRPVAANIDILDVSGRIVARTASRTDGHYAVSLAPGSYSVMPSIDGTFPRCSSVRVTVAPGTASRADISCDTGIR